MPPDDTTRGSDDEFEIETTSAREQADRDDPRTGRAAAAARIQQQQTWVDLQVRRAMERGDFDDLPGAGKPIQGLGERHDPDWWVKRLVERENITGVLPEALQLRTVDAELDDSLDRLAVEREVRREVEEFNARVLRARYTPVDGPPLVTMPRDVDETVAAWEARRAERRAALRRQRAAATTAAPPAAAEPRRRWWRRRPPAADSPEALPPHDPA